MEEHFIRVVTLGSYGLVAGMRAVDGVIFEISVRNGSIEGDLVRTDVLRSDTGVKHAKTLFARYVAENYPPLRS